MKENKKYWYLFYIEECFLCGRTDEYKERRYTKKPENRVDRYSYKQIYCYCDERYL